MKRLIISLVIFASNLFSQLVDFAPHNMTSGTAPSPLVVTTTSNYGGQAGWQAFDGHALSYGNNGGWITNSTPTASLIIDFGSGNTNIMLVYGIRQSQAAFAPTAWTMQGSNDGSSFTIIDTRTSINNWAHNQGSQQFKYFIVMTTSTAYRYFKFSMTATVGGSFGEIDQFYFYGGSFQAPIITGGSFSPTTLTNYVSGFPVVIDSSSQFNNSSYAPWNPFSASAPKTQSGNIWAANAATGSVYLNTLSTGVYLTSYSLTIPPFTSGADINSPTGWTIQGSNDGATWTTLDTQSGVTWTSGQTHTYTVSGASKYIAYAINITGTTGPTGLNAGLANIVYSGVISNFTSNVSVITVGP